MVKYFGLEPSFSQKFQIQSVEWKFYGPYSGGARFFVIFPVMRGKRLLVEIRKENKIWINRIKKHLRLLDKAAKEKEWDRYVEELKIIFELVLKHMKQCFLEELKDDVLKRIRFKPRSKK